MTDTTTVLKAPDSASIMLLPDATYRAAHPKSKEPHLTVAFYGAASQMSEQGKSRLRGLVDGIANTFGTVKAQSAGIGIMGTAIGGFALVDLIDGIGPLNVRAYVTQFDGLDGTHIDTRHGFTPHITREYLKPEDAFYAEVDAGQIDNIEFTFDVVGLWFGAERYEVTLR